MSSANIFGGTPKKTLDLIKHSNNNCSIYFWSNEYKEYQSLFKDAGANIYVGGYGRNLYLQIKAILKVIDSDKIESVELLGWDPNSCVWSVVGTPILLIWLIMELLVSCIFLTRVIMDLVSLSLPSLVGSIRL